MSGFGTFGVSGLGFGTFGLSTGLFRSCRVWPGFASEFLPSSCGARNELKVWELRARIKGLGC